jgi:sugar phosphate isomerase/epimerase
MKLGFIGVNDLPGIEEDARFASEHGFQGIEFNYWANFEDLTVETVVKMRDILDRHGVRASALGLWGWNHISPDPDERKTSLGHLGRAIEFAQMLDASVLITGGGQIPGASPEDNVAQFAEVFPPLVAQAEEAGLKIALYAMRGNSFLTSIEAYERVWEHIPEVGIKYDAASFLHYAGDYLSILRDHGDRVFYVHIKENLYMDGERALQPAAGMGDIQWGKVMAFLHEYSYDGYLSIEPHGRWSRPPLRRTMLLLSQRHIRQFLL